MARNDIEVSVGVKDLRLVADRNGRDETVCQLTGSLAMTATCAIKLSRLLIVRRSLYGQQGTSVQQASKPIAITAVAGAGQNLHKDNVRDGKLDFFF